MRAPRNHPSTRKTATHRDQRDQGLATFNGPAGNKINVTGNQVKVLLGRTSMDVELKRGELPVKSRDGTERKNAAFNETACSAEASPARWCRRSTFRRDLRLVPKRPTASSTWRPGGEGHRTTWAPQSLGGGALHHAARRRFFRSSATSASTAWTRVVGGVTAPLMPAAWGKNACAFGLVRSWRQRSGRGCAAIVAHVQLRGTAD